MSKSFFAVLRKLNESEASSEDRLDLSDWEEGKWGWESKDVDLWFSFRKDSGILMKYRGVGMSSASTATIADGESLDPEGKVAKVLKAFPAIGSLSSDQDVWVGRLNWKWKVLGLRAWQDSGGELRVFSGKGEETYDPVPPIKWEL